MDTKRLIKIILAALFFVTFIDGCKKDNFVAINGVCPLVVSTDPANLITSVPLDKVISATFNEPMNPLTITAASFSLQAATKGSTTQIPGNLTYDVPNQRMSFTPANKLSANTTYSCKVTTLVKDLMGNALQTNYVWTFSSGATISPTIQTTDPSNSGTEVVLNKIINATFSVPMDPLTITASTFTLKQGTTQISGTVSYSGTTASFRPAVNLLSGTIYTASFASAIKNMSGTTLMNDYSWTFTTGTIIAPNVLSTDPANNVTGVLLNKSVKATFSVPMDPLTITSTTFTLKTGVTSVEGTVTYSGSSATFIPTGGLLSGNNYTASITTGAKNTNGVSLANNYVWNFSTTAPLGPLGVNLKSLGRFGIIAGVGVSNNAGFSVINNMDVGIYPGVRSSVTGFPPASIVNGAMYASDDIAPAGVPAMLIQAKQDLTDAYLFAEAATSPAPATLAGDQGGKTLAPGIYKTTSTLLIQLGDLTLDAQGDANAVWIFQVSSDFTTVGGAGGNVILSGGAQAKNVFWQVGRSATIGDFTSFTGNVLALTSITMNSGATATGRMLARNGSVVLTSTNLIYKP